MRAIGSASNLLAFVLRLERHAIDRGEEAGYRTPLKRQHMIGTRHQT